MIEEPRKRGRPRQDRCLRGHNLNDPANVRIIANGQRQCRACMRQTRLRWYRKARQQTGVQIAAE